MEFDRPMRSVGQRFFHYIDVFLLLYTFPVRLLIGALFVGVALFPMDAVVIIVKYRAYKLVGN